MSKKFTDYAIELRSFFNTRGSDDARSAQVAGVVLSLLSTVEAAVPEGATVDTDDESFINEAFGSIAGFIDLKIGESEGKSNKEEVERLRNLPSQKALASAQIEKILSEIGL